MTRVLFVCVQNAGRSQMAEAFAVAAGLDARSAGSRPADAVHPEVVEAMRERGTDLGGRVPRPLLQEDVAWADVVVTMGCGDACPVLPRTAYRDWQLEDPHGRGLDAVRAIRDDIERRVAELAHDTGADPKDIRISASVEDISPADLDGGFWEGWPDHPSPERHLELLRGSLSVALALAGDGKVVGFATAVGDGVLTAYVPLLEVLPAHRGRGIGTRLVERLLQDLAPCYMVDVACDDDVVPFYERLGFTRTNAMIRRDYAAQAGS